MNRTSALYFLLFSLSACLGEEDSEVDAPLLVEGTYSFTIEDLTANSCGSGMDEYVGVGQTILLDLRWIDSDTFRLSDGDVKAEYEVVDGDQVERIDFDIVTIEGSCSMRTDRSYDGRILSTTLFTTEAVWEFSTEGDCKGVEDADGLPCTVRFETKTKLLK